MTSLDDVTSKRVNVQMYHVIHWLSVGCTYPMIGAIPFWPLIIIIRRRLLSSPKSPEDEESSFKRRSGRSPCIPPCIPPPDIIERRRRSDMLLELELVSYFMIASWAALTSASETPAFFV